MAQVKTGLVSVTFRQKSVEEIAALTAEAGLSGVEWGGDVHVPPGDREAARRAAQLTHRAGLEVLSVHQMGRHKTAAVRGSAAQLRAAQDSGADVDISPMNLQNVFVALCGHGDEG